MNYFEIKPDGQAYIRTDSGTVIRKVGNGEPVEFADFNKKESLFVIAYQSGLCELRDVKNKLVKTIAEGGVRKAFMKTDGILLVYEDGMEVMYKDFDA